MKQMKSKINLLMLLFFASLSADALAKAESHNSMFYNTAIQPVSNDWRVSGLVAGGITIATSAALLKLVSAFMKENGLNKSSLQKSDENVELKDRFAEFCEFCKKFVPSTSTTFIVGGLMVALCSKQLVNFYESCYLSWAFDFLRSDLKPLAEKALQKNIAQS